MPLELKVPAVGESITEVQIGEWVKAAGEGVNTDETIVMIDTEKTTVELPAPTSGTITQILKNTGEMASVGEVIGYMEPGDGKAAAPAATDAPAATEEKAGGASEPKPEWEKPRGTAGAATPAAANAAPASATPANAAPSADGKPAEEPRVMPAAQRLLAENNLQASQVEATGPGGRVLKEDVQRELDKPKTAAPTPAPTPSTTPAPAPATTQEGRADEEVVPMTLLRRRVAENLKRAQQEAALLTTFNEIDMSAVMQLRKENQDSFSKKYGIKLGFMSFFVKASIDALKQIPGVNAEIRGTNIVYRNHYDVGVAIGGGKGLVVPVLRNAERLSFAEIEQSIADFAKRAKENTLKPEELMGGTFTITNGGIYGSLLSTPIVNPPQSGILGMHAIQERPVAVNGEVVIRPMMYVALTYDHRLVDGREAVTFLVRIKECIENPARMLIEA